MSADITLSPSAILSAIAALNADATFPSVIIDPLADSWYGLYGQSLALGTGGAPAINTTSTYPGEVLEENVGNTALQDLVEASAETSAFSIGTEARTLRGEGTFGVVSGGAGGTALSGLIRGTTPWNNFIAELTAARTHTLAAGRTFRMRAVFMFHGESDEIAQNTNYGTELLAFQADLESEIQSIQGTTQTIPLILYQLSSYNMAVGDANVALQQLAIARSNPNQIKILGPQYTYPYDADRLHFVNTSYVRIGEKCAQVANAVDFDAAHAWSPVWPTSIVASGSVVTVRFNVPTPPLLFDLTNLATKALRGFEIHDPTIQGITLSSVALNGTDGVDLTLSGAPNSQVQIGYGLDGDSGNAGGLAGNPTTLQAGAPGGNLVDSDAEPNGCVHFLDPIDSGFTTSPASVATHAISMPDTDDVIEIPHDAALDATDDYTILIRLRRPGTTHNQFVVEKGGTAAWSVRSWTGAGQAELSTYWGGVNFRTSMGAAPGYWPVDEWNTWVLRYSQNNGYDIVRDGVVIPRTGVVTPTAAIGTNTSPIEIGMSVAAHDIDFLQFAVWPGLALTNDQVWEISQNPNDLSSLSFTSPLVWLRPTAADDLTTSGGIINHGTGGSTFDATGTNLVAGDLITYP